jgi:creatinine amidohydrolase
MSGPVQLQWLRPDEVQQRKAIAYLPIGPLEWHGPHLPLGTDPLQAEHLALALAQQVGGVVYPTLYWGTERERSPELLRDLGFRGDEWIVGMDWPTNPMPSFYSPEEQFALVVRWTLEGLVAHGFRLIVIVNGHGATNQIEQLKRLVAEFNARGPARLLYTFTLDYVTSDPGHATITETAAILALDASRVDTTSLPPAEQPLRNSAWAIVDAPTFSGQPTPDHTVRPEADPRRATPALGEQNFAAALAKLSEMVSGAWAGV